MAGHAVGARLRTIGLGVAAVALLLATGTGPAAGGTREPFTRGAPGVGDPYFPLDGNGG